MNDEADWVNLLNFEDVSDVATEFPLATSKVDSWMEELEECLMKDNDDDNSRSTVDYFDHFDLEMCDLGIIDHLQSGERPPSTQPQVINGVTPDFDSTCEIHNDLFFLLGNAGCDDCKNSPIFESNCENDKNFPNFYPNLEFLGNGGCDNGKNSPNCESNAENDKNIPDFNPNLEFLGNGGCDNGKNSPNFESNSENDTSSLLLGNGVRENDKNSPNFGSNSENDKNSPNFEPNCENEKVEDVNGDDPDSKKRKRQLRNRDAAMRSRERKKILVKDLEMKSRYFEEECRRLRRLLHCCYAENQWLRSLQTYGTPMTKPESAVLLLESLLLGSLVWLMVNICLFPRFKLPLSNQDAALLVSVDRKLLESAAPRRKGTNISELWMTLLFTRSKRCKASRTRMKSHSSCCVSTYPPSALPMPNPLYMFTAESGHQRWCHCYV